MKKSDSEGIIFKAITLLSFMPGFSYPDASVVVREEQASGNKSREKLNVLFIAVDDFRPLLGCYGDTLVHSPNFDRIASRGIVFTNAYCQTSLSNPSRSSLMTGLRPETTGVHDNQRIFRKILPDVVTIPQQFRLHGYYSCGYGKIFHGGGVFNDPLTWSVPAWFPNRPPFLTPEGKAIVEREKRGEYNGIPWEYPDVSDNALKDGATAEKAVIDLERIKDRPFFMAVGFSKPHLPLVAPKKYWDLYDPDIFTVADNPFPPEDAPEWAVRKSGLGGLIGMPNGPVPEKDAIMVIHGYYACVSYVDAQIGLLLDELDRLNLTGKTVIVLYGDQGFHLGEHGIWSKFTNFDVANRSPLIISVPGMKSAGKSSEALVEFVDIYPTLCDICGIPLPEGLEGVSLKPLLKNPDRKLKNAAFYSNLVNMPGADSVLSRSVRTEKYRFTEYAANDKAFYELYDHVVDKKENINLANRPEYADLVKQMKSQLHAGWKAALIKK